MKSNIKERVEKAAILDWVLSMMAYPYEIKLGGPQSDGNSCRGKGSEWYLSYKRTDNVSGFDGCVYAPTRDEVIAKGMKLHATQKKVERMFAEAKA